MLSVLLASALAAAPAPPAPAAPAQPDATVASLSLKSLTATLRQPLDADGRNLAALAPGYPLTCGPARAGAASGVRVCRFERRYGAFLEPPSLSLEGRYRINHLQFSVADGRIVGVSFESSLDRYDGLLQRLQAEFGASQPIRRLRVATPVGDRPAVHVAWSGPAARVALDAPALPRLDLRVTIASPRAPRVRTPA